MRNATALRSVAWLALPALAAAVALGPHETVHTVDNVYNLYNVGTVPAVSAVQALKKS